MSGLWGRAYRRRDNVGQAAVDANRLALRLQTETDDVAAPEPGDGEDDAEKGQQHAEDEEGFAARDRSGYPVEVHPKKAGERGDGRKRTSLSHHKMSAFDPKPTLGLVGYEASVSTQKSYCHSPICKRSKIVTMIIIDTVVTVARPVSECTGS